MKKWASIQRRIKTALDLIPLTRSELIGLSLLTLGLIVGGTISLLDWLNPDSIEEFRIIRGTLPIPIASEAESLKIDTTKDASVRLRKLKPGQGKVNLNTASLDEFRRLPGVGPKLADRIVQWRKEKGGFRSPDDLKKIRGIGDKVFKKLEEMVEVDTKTSKLSPQRPTHQDKVLGKEETRVNLNTATFDELQGLPGIGPKMAERIIQWRKDQGSFKSVEDLRKIKGIGGKTYEKLKPLAEVK